MTITDLDCRILAALSAVLRDQATGVAIDLPTSIGHRVGEKPGTIEVQLRRLADEGYLIVKPEDWHTERPPRDRIPVVGLTPAGQTALAGCRK